MLREVSVVGREFLYGLVCSVATAPDSLDDSLADLAAADLIREKATDPELEYIFKHALTQEVAYDGLLRREREELHERVAKAIEDLLADRTGEFIETLAYHYERSGHVVEAVDYLRRAGRKGLDRYAISEADAHYRSAHSLLMSTDAETVAVPAAERDRLLLELILDWAHVRYYTAEFNELHRLQQLHHELPARVADDALTARWLAWAGHVAFLHLNDLGLSTELLDAALDLGEQCNDPTGQAYALAWLTWTLWTAGDTARVLTLWPRLEAVLPRVPDPHDQRYADIKGRGGTATAAAHRGDTRTARAYANELIEVGERTGNRRAVAMAHLALGATSMVLGNRQEAIAATVAAAAGGADPVYALAAALYSAGVNTMWGDPNDARRTCDEWRPFTVRLEIATDTPFFDAYQAMIAVGSGHLSRGMRDLADVRAVAAAGGNDWLCFFIDFFLAVMYSATRHGRGERLRRSGIAEPRIRPPPRTRRRQARACCARRSRLNRRSPRVWRIPRDLGVRARQTRGTRAPS